MNEQKFPTLNETEAAQLLGLSPRTLQNWRQSGMGPTFHKLGRAVRYTPAELSAFVEASTRRHSSAPGR